MEIVYIKEGQTLTHHGVKGQRWGIRRYQNPDGTLTDAGKRRYAKMNIDKRVEKSFKKHLGNEQLIENERKRFDAWDDAEKAWYFNEDPTKKQELKRRKLELEEKDPYFVIENEVIKGLEKQYPGLNQLDREMVIYSLHNIFSVNIWDPVLEPKYPIPEDSKKKKSGVGSKIADALIDVGKTVAGAALTKHIVG